MDLTKIKVEAIPDGVREWCNQNAHNTSHTFCAWFEYIGGEIVERCFGTRKYKKHGIKITEVLRCQTGEKQCTVVKNLITGGMSGYIPIYEAEDRYYSNYGYRYQVFEKTDFDKWYSPQGPVGFSYVPINENMVFDIPEFKYCGYSGANGLISYINAYRKDHNVEFFGKMGLRLSPVLMNKAKKDGKFRRFLFENANAIALYGVQAALYAYKNGCDVESARRECYLNNQLNRVAANRVPEIRGTILDRKKVLDYIDSNNINYASYGDYLKCLKALRLSLADTKNVFPKDFARMHELRAVEYASQEAKIDRRKRAKLYRQFREVAKSAKEYEYVGESYSIIVPSDISDLKREGDVLEHCVGKMGYDKKMADGISLIMFVRKNDEPHIPFVTVEYRLDLKKLRQCYGYRDSAPSLEVRSFCEMWEKMITERLVKNG